MTPLQQIYLKNAAITPPNADPAYTEYVHMLREPKMASNALKRAGPFNSSSTAYPYSFTISGEDATRPTWTADII